MALFYPHYINEIQVHNLKIFQLCGNMPYWISTYFVKCWFHEFHEFHVLPQGPCSKVFFWRDFTSCDQNRPVEPTAFGMANPTTTHSHTDSKGKNFIEFWFQCKCGAQLLYSLYTLDISTAFIWTSSNSNRTFQMTPPNYPSNSIFQWKTIYIAIVKSSLSDLIVETTIETTLAPSLQNHSSDSPSLAHLFCLFIVAIAWLKSGWKTLLKISGIVDCQPWRMFTS